VKLRRGALLAMVLLAAAALLPRATTFVLARGNVVHVPGDLPKLADGEHRAAIVPGAGLVGDRPSTLLRERIDGAIELLESGQVDLLLMSGDNRTEFHDEPTAMRRYAIERGVGVEQVAADYAGRRTWDTCARAQGVFGIERAVVVTNAFHVDRARLACNAAGVDTIGYSVDDRSHARSSRVRWRVRELAATGRALVDAWIVQPEPAVGGDRIDPWAPCELRDSLTPSDAARDADAFARLGC
jgi:SanA protein